MRKASLLYTALVLVVILGGLHLLAIHFYFYWTLWWFDILMHTLGGFAGTLFILWFISPVTGFRSAFIAILALLAIGVVWEIFEYVYDIAVIGNYWQDTIGDLISDVVGAILACLYAMSGRIREYFSVSREH